MKLEKYLSEKTEREILACEINIYFKEHFDTKEIEKFKKNLLKDLNKYANISKIEIDYIYGKNNRYKDWHIL